jgi:hypothetical protein
LLWGLGLVIPLVATAVDVLQPSSYRVLGRDFSNFWLGGTLSLEGRASCAFDPACFRLELLQHLSIMSAQNYSYPPHALLLNAPFAILPYHLAFAVWTSFGVAFFAICARPYLPKGFPTALAVVTPAAGFCIWDGQYGLFIGGLWMLSFRALQYQPVRAGLSAALITIKPHIGLLLGVTMLVRWRLLAATVATATVVAMIAVSAWVFGMDSWRQFFDRTTAEQVGMISRDGTDFYFRMMSSVYPRWGWWGQAAFATFAGACLWRIRQVPIASLAFPAATATFLILPYSFNYDMTVACLGFAVLLFQHWWQLGAARLMLFALAFNTPQLTFIMPAAIPLILAAALFEQCRLQRANDLMGNELPIAGQSQRMA